MQKYYESKSLSSRIINIVYNKKKTGNMQHTIESMAPEGSG
jgi:hypothetical protein